MDQDTRALGPQPDQPEDAAPPAGTSYAPPAGSNYTPAPSGSAPVAPSAPYAGSAPPPADYVPGYDGRAQRVAERKQRLAARRAQRRSGGGGWVVGVVLIILGVVFLAQNAGVPLLNNWWALFILIPALGAFESAWMLYRRQGQWTSAATGPLIGGAILTVVAASFLFGWDLGLLFPFFLIIGGAAMLLGSMSRPA